MSRREKHQDLRGLLHARGLRATPSRLAVLELLRESANSQPLSHADITERLTAGAWDPATLYRNLTDLVDAHLLRRTDVGDHVWRFELLDAAHDAASHPHFVCTECGIVECLPATEIVVPRARTPRAVRQRRVEVQVRGLCDTCG